MDSAMCTATHAGRLSTTWLTLMISNVRIADPLLSSLLRRIISRSKTRQVKRLPSSRSLVSRQGKKEVDQHTRTLIPFDFFSVMCQIDHKAFQGLLSNNNRDSRRTHSKVFLVIFSAGRVGVWVIFLILRSGPEASDLQITSHPTLQKTSGHSTKVKIFLKILSDRCSKLENKAREDPQTVRACNNCQWSK